MRRQLSKDPLFQVKESPVKALKERELQRQKNLRLMRMHPISKKHQSDKQIIDPLPLQLKNYRNQTSYKTSVESSKASQSLKKYVIEQQKNLRCLRLERFADSQEKISTSRLKSMTLNMNQIREDEKNSKEINIPKIEDLFKNQSKEILIYQNTTLREKLGKMILNLDQNISRFKSMSYSHAKQDEIAVKLESSQSNVNNSEEDYEIDKIIQKKLKKSQNLRDKLYKQKREMMNSSGHQEQSNSNNMSYFLKPVQKAKKKELLKGIKYYSYVDGSRKLELTSAGGLLFEMHKLSDDRDKKQSELTGLLKNSYQNRDSILSEKSMFYEGESTFMDLSPSNQFKLRKVMNKKLNHRLQISKEQVNKFVKYLGEVRNYHVILNDSILQVLKEARELLLSGKVMKITDLKGLLESKPEQDLQGYPNQLIISKLTEMMI